MRGTLLNSTHEPNTDRLRVHRPPSKRDCRGGAWVRCEGWQSKPLALPLNISKVERSEPCVARHDLLFDLVVRVCGLGRSDMVGWVG